MRLAKKYERTSFSYFVQVIEPLGILFGAVGILLAAGGLFFAGWTVQLALVEIEESRKLRKATLLEFEANRELREKTRQEFRDNRFLREATLGEFEADRKLREETREEFKESRTLREATLFALLMERFETAQAEDANGSATIVRRVATGYRHRKCNRGSDQLAAQVGQIEILERMAELGISLHAIRAVRINFRSNIERESVSAGIRLLKSNLVNADFRESNLANANFSGSDLQFAKFSRSCLEYVQFTDVDLRGATLVKSDLSNADFTDADLSGADLAWADLSLANFARVNMDDTDLTGADLRSATNLAQKQLDIACANTKKLVPRVPNGRTWKGRDCP